MLLFSSGHAVHTPKHKDHWKALCASMNKPLCEGRSHHWTRNTWNYSRRGDESTRPKRWPSCSRHCVIDMLTFTVDTTMLSYLFICKSPSVLGWSITAAYKISAYFWTCYVQCCTYWRCISIKQMLYVNFKTVSSSTIIIQLLLCRSGQSIWHGRSISLHGTEFIGKQDSTSLFVTGLSLILYIERIQNPWHQQITATRMWWHLKHKVTGKRLTIIHRYSWTSLNCFVWRPRQELLYNDQLL